MIRQNDLRTDKKPLEKNMKFASTKNNRSFYEPSDNSVLVDARPALNRHN